MPDLATPEGSNGSLGAPQTLLVVDDVDSRRTALADMLMRAGYRVSEAHDGREALGRAAAEPLPDLIVLTIDLAGIDGFEICHRLKADPVTAAIPVLHISSTYTNLEDHVFGAETGAEGYLVRPIDPGELLATVQALLRVRQAEETARIASNQWEKTFNAIGDAICLVDGDGHVLRSNRAMKELLNRAPSQLRGQSLCRLLTEELGIAKPALECVQTLRRREVFECQAGERWFRCSVDPIADRRGLLSAAVVVVSEVTAEKRMEAERQQTEEILRMNEKLAATGRLAATIAHEINNPMASVTNLLYLLDTDAGLSERSRSYVALARQEVTRMAHIVKQMLGFYRESVAPVRLRLAEVIENVLELHGTALRAQRVQLDKQIECLGEIEGFPGEMHQVLTNLILNAVEAMGPGGKLKLRLYASCDRGMPERPGVRIVVADNGPGIAAENRLHVFEPFFTTKGERGTGLGLWVTEGIVRKHGGRIRVHSSVRPGASGTVFTIFLPSAAPSVQPRNTRRNTG